MQHDFLAVTSIFDLDSFLDFFFLKETMVFL